MNVTELHERGFMLVEDCARTMGVTVERVQHLVTCGALRSTPDRLWVQPAIVTGAVE